VWLTQEGLARDIFAEGGADVPLRDEGRVVVEGLGAARVELITPASLISAAMQLVEKGWHSMVSALRSLRVRGQFGPRAEEPVL
jgi:hypothetical protein